MRSAAARSLRVLPPNAIARQLQRTLGCRRRFPEPKNAGFEVIARTWRDPMATALRALPRGFWHGDLRFPECCLVNL